jgi:hypothetical protein
MADEPLSAVGASFPEATEEEGGECQVPQQGGTVNGNINSVVGGDDLVSGELPPLPPQLPAEVGDPNSGVDEEDDDGKYPDEQTISSQLFEDEYIDI